MIIFAGLADPIIGPGLGLEKRLKIDWSRIASGSHNILEEQVLRIQGRLNRFSIKADLAQRYAKARIGID